MRRPIWFGRQRLIVEMEDPPPPDLGLFGEELVCGEDGLSLSYPVGILKESEASPDSFEIAIVARDPVRGFLVCLPKLAWDRKANKRKLPAQSLIKPLHIVLAACGEDSDRLTASEGCQCSVWIAWLKPELVGIYKFPRGFKCQPPFCRPGDGGKMLPFAEALLAVAREKFGILPSEEPGVGPDERLAALEEKFSFLQEVWKSFWPCTKKDLDMSQQKRICLRHTDPRRSRRLLRPLLPRPRQNLWDDKLLWFLLLQVLCKLNFQV